MRLTAGPAIEYNHVGTWDDYPDPWLHLAIANGTIARLEQRLGHPLTGMPEQRSAA